MVMPAWWGQRRYGLFVHANLATVPAWAPIGEYADWYWSHLGGDVPDVLLHPRPLVEVLAHHRDRWGHIDRFDDFAPLLTFDEFDAEAWARLAVDAGMGYTVLVTKHHDGWCWWDAPGTDRTFVAHGPRRNVLAEYAAACERNDLVFGSYYSLLDWGDPRYPSEDYVTEVLHPHVLDLIDRYGSRVLWGDGHWGHGPERWRSRELLERALERVPDLVINDRWWATADDLPAGAAPIVRTYEYETPDEIVDGPWELCRGIGGSFGHNRAERAEHHLSGFDIVALLTEVVAKGGNLLLDVGPDASGTIPPLQAEPLRDAGTWVRRHHELLAGAAPWEQWGDDDVRYLAVDGDVFAVDVAGRGRFAALTPDAAPVVGVEPVGRSVKDRSDGAVDADGIRFHQDRDGLQLDLPRTEGRWHAGRPAVDVAVYRLDVKRVEAPVTLFAAEPAAPIALAPLVASAQPGDIVQLGDGVYQGPVTVPPGVVLRGLGPNRTTVDGGGGPGLTLERGARVEHLRVAGAAPRAAWFPVPAVVLAGPLATLLGCDVDGHVVVRANDALLRATHASGIVAEHCERLTISRCQLTGMRWDVGIHISGGGDHEIDSCTLSDHLCAIRVSDTTGTVVRGSTIAARWWGVHLERTERAHVHGNQIRDTMRAVDVDGGNQALIEGNAVCDGDSGCLVEGGASDCRVSGNHWERCRVGLMAWDAVELHHQGNNVTSLHEPDNAVVTGP